MKGEILTSFEAVHPIWLLLLTLIVAFLPVVASIATSYLKISIVLGLLRNALGTQQVPSGMIIMALSLAFSLFAMSPVLDQSYAKLSAIKPALFLRSPADAPWGELGTLADPWRDFLGKHAGAKETAVLVEILTESEQEKFQSLAEAERIVRLESLRKDFRVLLASFMLTELKEAFSMGFAVLLPFLVIDLIVAHILVGLGMFMLSPVMISLPIKVILLVVSDGWLLIMKGLVNSYLVN